MLAKAVGNYTLETLYSSLLTDTGKQAGAFRERNWQVYNWIMDYVDQSIEFKNHYPDFLLFYRILTENLELDRDFFCRIFKF